MRIGMVGLGRMGANMSERLVRGGHEVIGFDLAPAAVQAAQDFGAEGATSLEDLVDRLSAPRVVWIMVPSGAPVDATIDSLAPLLGEGDVVLDGGNSNYKHTLDRHARLASAGVEYVDVGTSGGVWGLDQGYSLMVGGETATVANLSPLFETLAPAPDRGWGHVGGPGSGHFVKMIHNGIEYGLMQAYAEGFAILHDKESWDLDLHQIAQVWRHGSVVRSWLLDLTAEVFADNADLDGIAAYVPDSGYGRGTVSEAIDLNISAPVIAMSLMKRIGSRDEVEYSDKLLSAMRNKFGGHAIREES